ncbi:hypothetical protein Ddye_019898 [Dipteronia dyeriana]|uniref:HAT C-terminal dimerisation domain-containing protein n=1 Tax=Dipteronia dyeriana TaxID=168575 RepID=A0AAD9WW21_9ROSI|nr:hypothetical protein Ddye_019898 [Dipteronia dyeriana]
MASGSGSGSGVRDSPPRHSVFRTDPNFEEAAEKDKKQLKSDLFVLHMKKVTKPNGTCWAVCNYCPKEYKLTKSGGYCIYRKHITTCHPAEFAKGNAQSQISRFSTRDTQLFKYSDQANREELVRMVAVEHLPFSFGEKVGFIKYCHKALNHAACRVPRTTLTRTIATNNLSGDDDVDKFDILHWWREHEKHFPILSIIAKQILATPVSTVAVEQEFSAGGNILDARRSLLSPESIQV